MIIRSTVLGLPWLLTALLLGAPTFAQVPAGTASPSQAEADRRARWEAYFAWRAKVAADAQASIHTSRAYEEMKSTFRNSPDPYATLPPVVPPDAPAYPRFGRWSVDILAGCVSAYSSPGYAYIVGYCPSVRLALTRSLHLVIEPEFGTMSSKSAPDSITTLSAPKTFAVIGVRPGIEFTVFRGQRARAAARGYVAAGFDSLFPFASDGHAPTVLLGGHAGLGVMAYLEQSAILGMEARALVQGASGGTTPLAQELSALRAGVELRFSLGFGTP